MNDSPTRYVEVALGSLGNRGQAVPLDVVRSPQYLKQHYTTPMWRSVFTYDEALPTYFETHRALKASSGLDAGLDRIWLDYEIEGDTGGELGACQDAVADVVKHMQYVLDVPTTAIQPWFSGRRGFHLELPNLFGLSPSPSLPSTLKASLQALVPHPQLDLKMIHGAGLIRLPWSKHDRSGLHKIPLTHDELQHASVDDIRAWAEDPATHRAGFTLQPLDDHRPLWEDEVVTSSRRARGLSFGGRKEGLSVRHDPTHIVTCMQHLLNRGAEPGRRHKDLLRLASWMYSSGIPLAIAQQGLADWAMEGGSNDDETPDQQRASYERIIRTTYEGGYVYSCQDEVKSEFCDPKCIFFDDKDHVPMVDNAQSLNKSYEEYLRRVREAGTSFDLGAMYGLGSYMVLPGDVMMVTGDTGLGKSSWVQNLEVDLPDFKVVHCTLEYPKYLHHRRNLQIAHGLRKEQVDHVLLEGSEAQKQQLTGPVDHILVRSTLPTLGDLEQLLVQLEPDIFVIDTTDAVEVQEAGTNENLAIKMLMNRLNDWAEKYMAIIIGIHHIKKSASERIEGTYDGSMQLTRQLTLNDLTGSRAAVTKADHVLALEGQRGEQRRTIRTLKGRDNAPTTLQFDVDWPTFRFQRPHKQTDPLA